MKKQNNTILLLFVFCTGFLAGTGFTVWKMGKIDSHKHTKATPATSQPSEQISFLKQQLVKNPKDGVGWLHLGNLYYDSNQPQKAIDAYLESLKFQPATPNMLTDLGVMYRRIHQPEKAILYFDKAIAQDKTHLPSRYNKGVVLLNDLIKPQKAIDVWQEIVKIDANATTGSGQKIADIVADVKKRYAGGNNK